MKDDSDSEKVAVCMIGTDDKDPNAVVKESLDYAFIVGLNVMGRSHAQQSFISGAWWFSQCVMKALPQDQATPALVQLVADAESAIRAMEQGMEMAAKANQKGGELS